MKKGIIFDVDGTLWDSAPQVTRSWNQVLAKEPGLDRQITCEDMYHYMGRTMDEIAALMLPQVEPERRRQIMDRCMEYENQYLLKHPGELYPQVVQTLQELSQTCELYIVSNCQDGYIQVLLEGCGLTPYIRDFECFGRTRRPKGENIRLVMERNGLEQAFYVGDTAMDQQAAIQAGLPFVHAAYGFGTASQPEGVIAEFAELPRLAARLLGGI